MTQIINLSVNILKVHSQNIDFFDDIEGEQYTRFKRSIAEDGVITPLIVTPDMTIISGHQRYKAAKDLGMKLIPAIIREDLTEADEQLKKLLATNFGRLQNNPVKQGRVYEQYEKLCGVRQGSAGNPDRQFVGGMTQEEIARELGVDTKQIQRLKQLQTLSPELQQLIEDGEVKYTTALNVWGKLSNEEQTKFINTMGKEQIANLTKKETESLLHEYKLLKKENEELKSKPPETVVVPPADYRATKAELEKLKTDLEMAEFKNRQLKRRMDEDDTPELFQRMAKKESEAQLKIIELNKKIDQLEADSKTIEHKVKIETINFCARVHNFLESVGGMAWITDYADLFDEKEKQGYLKALNAVDAWAQNLIINFKENEK